MCNYHWKRVPADIKQRYQWAREDESTAELLAALHAARCAVSEE